MITRMFLSDGSVVYPNFLKEAERMNLKKRIDNNEVTLQCSCRADVALLYGVSTDLRIVPLHQHYEHAKWCSRFNEDSNLPVKYDEEGRVLVRLKFDPMTFSIKKQETEDVLIPASDEQITGNEVDFPFEPQVATKRRKQKPPSLTLEKLVRIINYDTYTERIAAGKGILTEDYFYSAIIGHLKRVYISGMNGKCLRDLSLEEDHVAFFYNKVENLEGTILYLKGYNGTYRRFVPATVLAKAVNKFTDSFEVSPKEFMEQGNSLYAAGFTYRRLSKEGNAYLCAGRVLLFAVSKNGIYSENMVQKDALEQLFSYARMCGGVISFPDSEEAPYFCTFRIPKQRKEGYVFLGNKVKPTDKKVKAIAVADGLTKERLEKFVQEICFG